MIKIFTILLTLTNLCWASYPASWWAPVDESQRHSWEILPQAANRDKNEVILSKRNELGILSNFSHTPFELDGTGYESIEGFWQMMKYPDPVLRKDPRFDWDLPHTRIEVSKMVAFEAKEAGSLASDLMKKFRYPYVSYNGHRFNYKDFGKGSRYHYRLIYKATLEKVRFNPEVKRILMATKGLTLLPDHNQTGPVPPSYEYYKILMDIRDSLK